MKGALVVALILHSIKRCRGKWSWCAHQLSNCSTCSIYTEAFILNRTTGFSCLNLWIYVGLLSLLNAIKMNWLGFRNFIKIVCIIKINKWLKLDSVIYIIYMVWSSQSRSNMPMHKSTHTKGHDTNVFTNLQDYHEYQIYCVNAPIYKFFKLKIKLTIYTLKHLYSALKMWSSMWVNPA